MRYLHQSATEIQRYVDSRALNVVKCNNDGLSSPVATASGAIEEMLEQSQLLWGLSLPDFIHVSKSTAIRCVSISEAVASTEALVSSEDFLIVAYQDGGLISISGKLSAFQANAKQAQWWRPKY